MGKSGKAKAKKPAGKVHTSRQACPLVALYGLDAESERGATVRGVMANLGIAVRTIAPANLNDPVGAVAGMVGMHPARVPYAGEAPEDEFMLVCNCSSAQLDEVLSALRAEGASVAHKAQVTQFNRLWPVCKLMEEVGREHAALNA